MKSLINCDICEGAEWHEFTSVLIKCSGCGLVRYKERLDPQEAADIYQVNYFSGDGGGYVDYEADRTSLEENFMGRIKLLKSRSIINENSEVFEVGCAYGYFLNLLKKYVYKCCGCDVSSEAINYAKKLGVDAWLGDIPEKGSYDLVCMWDVIEHLPNPDIAIKKVSNILKPGGHLALTTGDIGSLVARIRKERWRMIHPPEHIFYFDKKTINQLLVKNNFKIIYFGHQKVYRNVESILRMLIKKNNKENKNTKLFEAGLGIIKFFKLEGMKIGINLFDIMEVIAVKK